MKKVLCVFMCFALVASLFGCSAKQEEETNGMAGEYSGLSSITTEEESGKEEISMVSRIDSTSKRTSSITKKFSPRVEPTAVEGDSYTMPDYVGGDVTEVLNALAGFNVSVVREYNYMDKDIVFKTVPAEGKDITKKTPITIYVSKGKNNVASDAPKTTSPKPPKTTKPQTTKPEAPNVILPKTPCVITGEKVGIRYKMTITKFEYIDNRLYVTYRNDSGSAGRCWIAFKIYDEDGVVIDTTFVETKLAAGESAKSKIRVPEGAYKITVDYSNSKMLET